MEMSVDVLVWMTVGIALLSSEAFTGTFHLLFFGLAALMTAVLASLGVNSAIVQMILFSVFSVVSVVLLRKRLVNRSQGFGGDEDRRFELSTAIRAGAEAVVQYQGVPWAAINASKQDLLPGDRVRVIRTEGIKLVIEPESSTEPVKS